MSGIHGTGVATVAPKLTLRIHWSIPPCVTVRTVAGASEGVPEPDVAFAFAVFTGSGRCVALAHRTSSSHVSRPRRVSEAIDSASGTDSQLPTTNSAYSAGNFS